MRRGTTVLCQRPKLAGRVAPRRTIASATFDVRRQRNKRLWVRAFDHDERCEAACAASWPLVAGYLYSLVSFLMHLIHHYL